MGIDLLRMLIISYDGLCSGAKDQKYPAPEQDPQQKVSKEDKIRNLSSEIYSDRVILEGIIARYLGSDSPEEKREMYIKEYDIRERMHKNELTLIRLQNED